MFERRIDAKAHYYWTEAVDGAVVKHSDLFSSREEMLRKMHEEIKMCRTEGTAFQPMINQEGECAEWGSCEIPTPDYKVLVFLNGEGEPSETAKTYWTLTDAVACANQYEERAMVVNPENTQIFYIKEAH